MATVLATFSVLKDHVKLKVSPDPAAIDNIIFKLHYRATFLILLASTLLVSSRQFFGEHIRCVVDNDKIQHAIETYCFIMSTFTVVKHSNLTLVNNEIIAHPGVGPYTKDDAVVYHAYYQWVPFVLFIQAILFYLPHYIWKSKEGGRLKSLVTGIRSTALAFRDEELVVNDNYTVPSRQTRNDKIQNIRTAFLNRLHLNRPWAYYLAFCEILNFVNVVAQFFITNAFLGNVFFQLGNKVAEGNFDGQIDALDVIFPKVTKCKFHKYGPTGSLQEHDYLCVMALNVINEKIYSFLWFWFIILSILSFLGLLWRIMAMTCHARSRRFNQVVFMLACPGKNRPWNILSVSRQHSFGDWLFLYYIAKNLDNYIFTEMFEKLVEDIDDRRMGMKKPLPDIPQQLENNEKEPLNAFDYEDHAKLP